MGPASTKPVRAGASIQWSFPAQPVVEERLLDLGRRDVLGPRQVAHLAILRQEVELAFPVVPHHEYVGCIPLYVVDLLVPPCLRKHLVDPANRLQYRTPVLVGQEGRLVLALVDRKSVV